MISEQVLDIALYSDSIEDLETGECVLLFQEVNIEPRNTHQPLTDFHVSKQPAQFVSL